jgi:hypothetical protein
VIAVAYRFYVARGEPGSEDALIRALGSAPDDSMAQAFLDSGNKRLAEAARKWAVTAGVTLEQGDGLKWGSARR